MTSAISLMFAVSGGACRARAYDAGSGDADVDHAVALADTVECARHEGVILHGVAEYNYLCSAEAARCPW